MTIPARTRFAPSPTGVPHIGNMRTALFAWLLARHTGGSFILRVEDTDRSRFDPNALEALYASLEWLGMDWDEGPLVDGPHAPYFQSERLPLYQDAAKRLIASGNAYECYCTPERLDAMRAAQREAKLPPGYDGRCSTDEGRAQAKADVGDRPPVVRFAMPNEGTTRVPDLLRDEVVFENVRLDDSVLLKSDGFPTYHLAVAVDDHEMEITHIIRSDEWLSSAPLHVRVFQALGYELPVMLHVPTVLGPDKAKLSKRHGAQAVLDYRDQGYLPEAIFNFLGLLGWSLDDKTEIISRSEFIEHFDLGRLLKSPAVFNIDKLNWMNGEYMRRMAIEELSALIIEQLEKPETEGGLPGSVPRPLDAFYTQQIVPLVRERVKLLPEARDMMAFFYMPAEIEYDLEMLLGKAFRDDRQRAALLLNEALVLAESGVGWEHEALEAAYRDLATRQGVRAGDLFMLMRVAITGRSVAPPLFETMAILGRERVVLRLRDAVGRL